MYFKPAFVALVALLGLTSAAPLPRLKDLKINQRDVQVLGLRSLPIDRVPELVTREPKKVIPKIINRRQRNGQPISAEIAVKSVDGQVIPFKRQNKPISAEIAVKSLDGNIVPFKRQDKPISAEIAVKSLDGNIVPF